MSWLKSVVNEIAGLFVDDGSFAAAIAIWVALVVVVAQLARLHGHWGGPVLFVGLAVVLVESVLRFARKAR